MDSNRPISTATSVAEIDPAALRAAMRPGAPGRRFFAYDRVEIVSDLDCARTMRPFATLALARAMTRPGGTIVLREGLATHSLGWDALVAAGWRLVADAAWLPGLRRRAWADVRALAARPKRRLGPSEAPPLFLATSALPSWGGAASHREGVLAGLAACGVPPHVARCGEDYPAPLRFRDFPSYVPLGDSEHAVRAIIARQPRPPSFVYQRIAAYDLTGLRLAAHYGVPFIGEYNGPEGWMARHWGHPLPHPRLLDAIETANLRGADLLVCVSQPLADNAVVRGVARDRVIVTPNGVDTARFSPTRSGAAVRAKLDWTNDDIVIGFAGSFGRWHGAEVLGRAFTLAYARRSSVHLRALFIGVGDTHAATKAAITGPAAAATAFVGPVPRAQMPEHLAACDILVSPQTPNPDGTPFFGSPTKLFEYMAMGRAIIASRLGQVAETIADDVNGLLVAPGSVEKLAEAILLLASDATLRARLGAQARADAVARHGWDLHAAAILDRLRTLPA